MLIIEDEAYVDRKGDKRQEKGIFRTTVEPVLVRLKKNQSVFVPLTTMPGKRSSVDYMNNALGRIVKLLWKDDAFESNEVTFKYKKIKTGDKETSGVKIYRVL